jgi:ketosteroid isomerase-like protein
VSQELTTPDLEETYRRFSAAVVRRDFDGAIAAFRSDAVWDGSATGVGVFEGRQAIRGFIADWYCAYQTFEQAIEEFGDLGDDVTLVVTLHRAQLPGSGGFVEGRYARVLTWTDGLIQRVTVYADVDEARAAAEQLAQERG